jgi:hypothetical protein
MTTPLERAAEALKREAAGFLTIEDGELAERFWIGMADAAITASQVPESFDLGDEMRISNLLGLSEKVSQVNRRRLVQRAAEMMSVDPATVVVGVRPDPLERPRP